MKLVFGYVRVSAIEQETGYGPEAQAERLRKYCTEHADELGNPEMIYESRSGESTVDRHEFNLMLARAEAAAEEGATVHVVFPGLDRLSRNLIDQESVVLRCQGRGIRLHSTLEAENHTLDPAYSGDPMRVAIRQFWGVINQLDRAIIQRRLDGGLARKAATGGFTGGRAPFGYQSTNRELEINETTAPIVRRIFAFHQTGLDQSSIAAVVAREYPQVCGHWHKRQVGRVLEREELYRHGSYRPRTGVQTVTRPELVILERALEDAPAPATGIDWDKLSNDVPLATLAALLGVSEDRLKELVSEHHILVKHRRSGVSVGRRQARQLFDFVRSSS